MEEEKEQEQQQLNDPNIFLVEEDSPGAYEITTLLHGAVDSDDIPLVLALLERGANPMLPNGDGDYPLELLLSTHVTDPTDEHAPSPEEMKAENAMRAVFEEWSRRESAPALSLERGMARLLLLRAVVLGDDGEGELERVVEACRGDLDFVFLCDAFYPDLGWMRRMEMTPLHRAVLSCQVGVDMTGATVAALLDAGASARARDGRGLTPLDLARGAMGYLKSRGKGSDFHMFYENGEFGLQNAITLLEERECSRQE